LGKGRSRDRGGQKRGAGERRDSKGEREGLGKGKSRERGGRKRGGWGRGRRKGKAVSKKKDRRQKHE
jgi:hypothetical protein